MVRTGTAASLVVGERQSFADKDPGFLDFSGERRTLVVLAVRVTAAECWVWGRANRKGMTRRARRPEKRNSCREIAGSVPDAQEIAKSCASYISIITSRLLLSSSPLLLCSTIFRSLVDVALCEILRRSCAYRRGSWIHTRISLPGLVGR